ncbi:MAG: putative acyl-CoA transferase/carnitine dehydratase [Brevundimonas sp.]|nr:putative acyl-CoA transferase/carnitine dehydratase [Brevundimonas sp.]
MNRPDASGFDAPLSGVRVIDLACGVMAVVGRRLAELGADVIRIESPQGSPDRRQGPAIKGVHMAYETANQGKRSVAIDLCDPDGRDEFEALLAEADILIDGGALAPDLDIETAKRGRPDLVILSISDFGLTGDFAEWHATEPVFHALSGELSRSGLPGRPPLTPPGALASQCAAAQATTALLVAYLNRLNSGLGDHLDFSTLDGATQALDPGYGVGGSATAGVPASDLPRGRAPSGHMYPVFRCADGHVRICLLAARQWLGMFEWMGRPEEFADKAYETLAKRFSSATLVPALGRFFADKTREEIEADGQRYGVPAAAVLSLDEALTTDQIRDRRAFARHELAPGLDVPLPDGVMEIDGVRARAGGLAPRLGEHQGSGFDHPRFAAAISWAAPSPERPLAGLKVLDLGIIVVGAEQGRLLADQGADVIKIENAAFPDGTRQTRDGSIMSITFAAGHRNKQALGLNLRSPEGKALFLQLVADADIVLSNFKPGALDALGLGHDTLAAINPRIISSDSSAFGPTGPWSGRMGYGPLVRASAGLASLWREAGDPDSFSDGLSAYPDHVCARIGITGVLALLIRRLRTGRGGRVSVSQAEVMLNHFAPEIAASVLQTEGHVLDDSLAHDAPWGVFPCAGDDEWCVVTVRGDEDFQALCSLMGRDDLAMEAGLQTSIGRDAARDRINAAVQAWLAERDPQSAMETLQAANVPAARMLRVSELPAFDYFVQRDFFRLVSHPLINRPFYLETRPVVSERLPDPPERPAPLTGADTRAIARFRLGLSDAQIGQLLEASVLEQAPQVADAA